MLKAPEVPFTLEEELRIRNWDQYLGAKRKEKYSHFFSSEQVRLVWVRLVWVKIG